MAIFKCMSICNWKSLYLQNVDFLLVLMLACKYGFDVCGLLCKFGLGCTIGSTRIRVQISVVCVNV
jgi:hypothetical protein